MEEKIDKVIEILLGLVRTNLTADEALKYSQAVLNVMHAKVQWTSIDQMVVKRAKTN